MNVDIHGGFSISPFCLDGATSLQMELLHQLPLLPQHSSSFLSWYSQETPLRHPQRYALDIS